jgi:hypothetical protein
LHERFERRGIDSLEKSGPSDDAAASAKDRADLATLAAKRQHPRA